jgi:hypothetical protein
VEKYDSGVPWQSRKEWGERVALTYSPLILKVGSDLSIIGDSHFALRDQTKDSVNPAWVETLARKEIPKEFPVNVVVFTGTILAHHIHLSV